MPESFSAELSMGPGGLALETELLFELSLAIGESTELEPMLRRFLSAGLRLLNGRLAVAFEHTADETPRVACALPRSVARSPLYQRLWSLWAAADHARSEGPSAPEPETPMVAMPWRHTEPDLACCVFNLPGFGAWLLCTATPLPASLVLGLRRLSLRLAHAARGCVAEARARAQAQRLELATRSAALGVWDWRVEDDVLSWDEQALRVIGVKAPTPTGLSGPLEAFLSRVALADRPRVREAMWASVRERRGLCDELSVLDSDGRRRQVSVNAVPEPGPDGEPVRRLIGVCQDVTQARQAEQALREAVRAGEAANQAKGRFVANLSHEFRTPINAVLGLLLLLRRSGLSARQADYAQKAEAATHALLSLINNVLDAAKLESDTLVLDPRPFSLRRMLQDLSLVFAGFTLGKPVEVMLDLDPALPDGLVGDDVRLRQVLVNLVGNGIKFTPRGEVELSIRQLSRSATHAVLGFAVRDTGIGIGEADLKRIFLPFVQADDGRARRAGGTGLGLSISQGMVRCMGGELTVQSTPGQGTRFEFRLELGLDAAAAVVPSAPPGPVAPGPVRKALVVDDSRVTCRLHLALLRSMGWEAESFLGGQAAVDWLREPGHQADLVLVDWDMPGLDGLATCEAIRALGLAHTPRLVLLTAHGLDMLTERSQEELELLDGFLLKPVTALTLQQTLDAMDAQAPRASVVSSGAPDAGTRPGAAPTGRTPPGQDAVTPAVVVSGATPRAPGPDEGPPPARRLRGRRLLVADDNPVNLEVARELLEAEGAKVTLAVDGAEALAQVRASLAPGRPRLDLVLMDMQMPEMDGVEATRAIRRLDGLGRLPILAMTANAHSPDRQVCLEAGMDDHVAKPYQVEHLVRTILHHLPPADLKDGPPPAEACPAVTSRGATLAVDGPPAAPGSDGRNVPPPAPTEAGAPTLPAALRVLAGLAGVELAPVLDRMGGKLSLLARVTHAFVQGLPEQRRSLAALAEAGDRVGLSRAAHSLKGLAATVGHTGLHEQAMALEDHLRAAPDPNAPLDRGPTLVAPLLATLDAALAPLERLARQLDAVAAPSPSTVHHATPRS